MTIIVPKGAGRPAAAERRERHAQRTPLPERDAYCQGTDDCTCGGCQFTREIWAE